MNGGRPIQEAIANSLYGNNRLRFTQELDNAYRQAYLNSVSQAAQQLDPKEAYQLGIVNDANPPQRPVFEQAPGTQDKGLLGSSDAIDNQEMIRQLINRAYDRKPKHVKG